MEKEVLIALPRQRSQPYPRSHYALRESRIRIDGGCRQKYYCSLACRGDWAVGVQGGRARAAKGCL
jgi:hypothetical protein